MKIWYLFDYMCGKRLAVVLRTTVDTLIEAERSPPGGVASEDSASWSATMASTALRSLSLAHRSEMIAPEARILNLELPAVITR